jgi:hypothetical protein
MNNTLRGGRSGFDLTWWGVLVVCSVAPFYLGYELTKEIGRFAKRKTQEVQWRIRANFRRLPRCRPISRALDAATATATAVLQPAQKSGFLRLPLEIRLQIYELALGGPKIAQPTLTSAFWGARPSNWPLQQRIRADDDAPSEALRRVILLGGSPFLQVPSPTRVGYVIYASSPRMICGDSYDVDRPGWLDPHAAVFYTDLMRTCRVIYDDLLCKLYSDNTISLFGAEMVHYFTRNAPPEGLAKVRFAHVAFIMPARKWKDRREKRSIAKAIHAINAHFPSLLDLDVEILLTFDQPADPGEFWAWLTKDALRELYGLRRFVLKVSVCRRELWFPLSDHGLHTGEPLVSWDDDDYARLKECVTMETD